MKIRVDRPVPGLFAECQPELGRVYEAREGRPPGGLKGKPFVVIDLPGKKNIVLRKGEYEIVEETAKKPPKGKRLPVDHGKVLAMLEAGVSVKDVAIEMGVTETTIRNIKKKEKKMEEKIDAMETERAVPAEDAPRGIAEQISAERLFDELCAARRENERLRKALLALVMEKYA